MSFFDASLLAFLGAFSLFGLFVVYMAIEEARHKPDWEEGATCMVCRKHPCVGCM